MSQPQIGQIANGHQWNGTTWVPITPPQIGQIANGHQWNGTTWVPITPPGDLPALLADLHGFATAWGFGWRDARHGVVKLDRVVAQRKALVATIRLEYRVKLTFDQARREVGFTQYLAESGSGLTGGDDGEFGGPSGFGFQKTSYNTATDGIGHDILEQAREFSRHYTLDFDYQQVAGQLAAICDRHGFTLAATRFSG